MSRDLVAMADEVYAGVSSDGIVVHPRNPCPFCGKESAEHTPDPDTGAWRMICMTESCRFVYAGKPKR